MKKKLIILIPIVVLIISIITIVILNIIEKKNLEEYKQNVKTYITNIEKNIQIEDTYLNKKIGKEVELDNEIIDSIEKGEFTPSSGTITIDETGKITKACFIGTYKEDTYLIKYKDDVSIKKTATDCNGVDLNIRDTVKENGEIIYFNPELGKKCSEKDYTLNEDASKTGNTSGCMKWFVFLDEKGSSNVNLLLDHNIEALVAWSNTGSNTSGPVGDNKLLNTLKNETSSWEGVKDRIDSYSLKKDEENLYTIDYEGYKARLISAEEIAAISDNDSFNFESSSAFYLGSTTLEDKTSRLKYTWLYDRMGGCFGLCENEDQTAYREKNGVSRSIILGYWTSSASLSDSSNAWIVNHDGSLTVANVSKNVRYGLRPVITISKAKVY